MKSNKNDLYIEDLNFSLRISEPSKQHSVWGADLAEVGFSSQKQ